MENIKTRIQKDELYPNDIYKFLTDANAELFDTAVIGAEVYKSVDAGKSWKKQMMKIIWMEYMVLWILFWKNSCITC